MKKFQGFQKGVNFGGWLSQRSYDKEYLDSFITEADFERVSKWGIDHVRVPVDYNIFETEEGEYKESGFGYVEKAIGWCRRYGLNMVLDLHKTCGFVFDNPDYVGFFSDESLQERFYRLWEQFAKRFGGNSDMLAFELLNEVTEPAFNDTWNRVARKAIETIRAYCPDIKILVGGYWNCAIDAIYDLDLPYDENVVYNFHCYDPLVFTHQSAYWVPTMPEGFKLSYPGSVSDYKEKTKLIEYDYLPLFDNLEEEEMNYHFFVNRFRKAAEYCEKHDIALYCGEYGVIDKANPKDAVNWYKDIHRAFEQFGIGRAAWSYKEVDFGLTDEHMAGVLDELIAYL